MGISTKESSRIIAELYLEMGSIDKAELWIREFDSVELWPELNLARHDYLGAKNRCEIVLGAGQILRRCRDHFSRSYGLGNCL